LSYRELLKHKISRRRFLIATGAAGTAMVIGNRLGYNVLLEDEFHLQPFTSGEWIPTGCAGCTSWCAKEVYVVNNRAIKIRANALSKVHRGHGCPRGHLALQEVYDPDRIKVPMKRTNPNKGKDEDPGFIPITWEEAVSTIADKIMDLRDNNETHKLLLMRGRYTQINQLVYGRMPKILGSNNNISHSSICAEAEKFGPYYTEGYWDYRDYDVENTNFVLVWGTDPLCSNRQVSHYLNAWGDLLERAEVAVVDPRFSITAAKSHYWLPVKPGEDGALAMALAHEILVSGMWNKDFVGDFSDGQNRFVNGESVDEESFRELYTSGLVKWWNLELKDRSAAWAAERCGIDEDKIKLVASRMSENAPRVIVWLGGGPVMQVRGAYNSMAIHALNGLLGSVDNEGGAIRGASVPHRSLPSADDYIDEIAAQGLNYPVIDQRGYKEFPSLKEGKPGSGVITNRVADAILSEDPHEIKVALGYWNNFNFSSPQAERWNEAMAKVPFFVHCGTNAAEMSRFADIVLPSTHHMFEQWGYLSQKGNRYTHVWLSRPLIKVLWDVKNFETEFVWMLGEELAKRGYSALNNFCRSIKDPETGNEPTDGKELELYANKYRLQPLWDPDEYVSGDRIDGWEDFVKKGVWNSDQYPFRTLWDNFGTATGKFEFYSVTLRDALQAHAEDHNTNIDDIMQTCKYECRGETAFIPHFEPPYIHGTDEGYTLVLIDSKSKMNREGRSANCPWYHELKDLDPGDEKGFDVARVNPDDAAKLNIADGDEIRIVSPTGSIECTAKLWEGVPPGTVSKTFGMGHWSYGRLASNDFHSTKSRGANNNDVIPADYERLSGSTAFYAVTGVKVEKL